MRIAISFDYDSPADHRKTFRQKHDHAPHEDGTESLLAALRRYEVAATFAVMGNAAARGKSPEHWPAQILAIHDAGHEIASHSMYHRFIPLMSDQELLEDAVESREALECCIGEPVVGFIPPFNRPMRFPKRWGVGFPERWELQGRGFGRQTVPRMLNILRFAGFLYSRVSSSGKFSLLLRGLGIGSAVLPPQPFVHRQMVAIPLHCGGFGQEARELVRLWAETDYCVTLYSHPTQAFATGDESVARLVEFLEFLTPHRSAGRVGFSTMRQLAAFTRDRA